MKMEIYVKSMLQNINEITEKQKDIESRISCLEISVQKVIEDVMPKLDKFLDDNQQSSSSSGQSDNNLPDPTSNLKPESSSTSSSSKSPPASSSSILDAAECGDSETVLKLLDSDIASVHERNSSGDTASHLAAAGGHEATVIVLLTRDAKSTLEGRRRRTPLHCAAAAGHVSVALRLVDAGVPIDARDADGATSLSLAAANDHAQMVSLLLDRRPPADVKAESSFFSGRFSRKESATAKPELETIIVEASKSGYWEVVKVLLHRGVFPTVFPDPKDSLLVLAAKAGNLEIVCELLKRGEGSDQEKVKLSLNITSNPRVVWAFVEYNSTGFNNKSRRHAALYAARDGRCEVLVALIETGANINFADNSGHTSLHFASYYGQTACVRALLDRKANLQARTKRGETPLHFACSSGAIESVKLLIDAGASIVVIDDNGNTPFEVAMSQEVRDILM